MNPAQRELLRRAILTTCELSKPYAAAMPVLLASIRSQGLRWVIAEDIAAELAYLTEKGLVAEEPKKISPENKAWRITAEGRDWMAQEGMA